jgi:hypothetical protein
MFRRQPGRAGLHHERREPQAGTAPERAHLGRELRQVGGEPVVRPPRSVRHLPTVVELDEVEAAPVAVALAQQAGVGEEGLPVDE